MRNSITVWVFLFCLFFVINGHSQDFAIRDAKISYEQDCKSSASKCKGSISWPDGSYYRGNLQNGIPNGWGSITQAGNNSYTGEFSDGLAHGKGQWTFSNGETYSGEWKNGEIHGKGVYTWKNGCKFHGLFKNGKMIGFGILQLPNGRSFRGNWENHLHKIEAKYHVKVQETRMKKTQGELFMPLGHVFLGSSKNSIGPKQYIAFQHINGKNRIFMWHKRPMSTMPDQVFFNGQLFSGDIEELRSIAEQNQKLTPGMINLWYSIGQYHISRKNFTEAKENLDFSLQFAKTGTKIHGIIKEHINEINTSAK